MDGDLNGTWMARDRKASLPLSTLNLGKGLAIVRCETDEDAEETDEDAEVEVGCTGTGALWVPWPKLASGEIPHCDLQVTGWHLSSAVDFMGMHACMHACCCCCCCIRVWERDLPLAVSHVYQGCKR